MKNAMSYRGINLFGGWVLLATLAGPRETWGEETVARTWDESLLRAISFDTPRITVLARNLFHVSAAKYAAWPAYNTTAARYLHGQKLSAGNVDPARKDTNSHAAYTPGPHR